MQSTLGTLSLPRNRFSGATNPPSPTKSSGRPVAVSKALGELVLIRGLPGSGKSTMAKVLALAGYVHYEADQFFEFNGVFRYDQARIRDAHKWCQRVARFSLEDGKRVVVSNTFTTLQEMEPYLDMTPNIRVIEAQGKWENCHGVPESTLERMALRWEALPAHFLSH